MGITFDGEGAMRIRRFGSLAGVLWCTACGGGGDGGTVTPPPENRVLTRTAGDQQTGVVGAAVAIVPRVKVATTSGAAVTGVQVSFAVTGGGGSVGQSTGTTDGAGEATPGSWSLGAAPGANVLVASVAGTTPASVTFTATAMTGPPAQVVKLAGDHQQAVVQTSVAIRPSVRVSDQFNNPVAGASVTFAVSSGGGTVADASQVTGSDGVATVGGWTLGAVGANSLEATVTGSAAAAVVFTATGDELLFSPAADTSVAGTIRVTRVVIPAGRTVTATAAVTIIVDSVASIAGTLRGTCVPITLVSRQSITITGSLDNSCAAADDNAPALRVIAGTGYTMTNATIASTGEIDITNDTTLTDAEFPAISSGRRRGVRSSSPGTSPALAVANPICVIGGGTYAITPDTARKGNSGRHGSPGGSGRHARISCRGDLVIAGGTIRAQHGGSGGDGLDDSNRPADASGGDGGPGGDVRIRATGVLSIGGASIRSGNGGSGGNAAAIGQVGLIGTRGTDANARGGDGAEGGIFDLRAGLEVQFEASTPLVVGRGGHGGAATALAANGSPAGAQAAQDGGHGTAEGGEGGSTRDKQLRAINVLNPHLAQVSGGSAGNGGVADAMAGNGGVPDKAFPRGGHGGQVNAIGGDGGDAQLRDVNGGLLGLGGDGGWASFSGAKGAAGWTNLCTLPDGFVPGGNGGNGGVASGHDGVGGSGSSNGQPGGVFVAASTGNAGTGGQGEPNGATGTVSDQITRTGQRTNAVPAGFSRGTPFPCVNVQPRSLDVPYPPNTLCGSPSLVKPISVGNFGAEPVTATITRVDPAGIFAAIFVFDAANANAPFTSGVFPVGNVNTGLGPRPNAMPICGGHVPPGFYCIRVEVSLGPTSKVARIPWRVREQAVPRDENADIAACAGIP